MSNQRLQTEQVSPGAASGGRGAPLTAQTSSLASPRPAIPRTAGGAFFQGKGAFTRHVDPSAPRSVDGAELIRKLYAGDADRRAEAARQPAADRLEQFIGISSSVFMIALGIVLVLIGLFPGWMRAFGL